LYRTTGRPVGELLRTCHRPSPLAAHVYVLDWPREQLYARIDARVDAMLAEGLVEETRALLADGIDAASPAFDSVGYTEVLAHLAGELTHEQMRLLIAQRTRNYAKRQLTWFRHRLASEHCVLREAEELDHVHERIVSAYLQSRAREASAPRHP
jgi:tRNA dimethylallyltransferase